MHSPEVTLWQHEFSEKKPLKVFYVGEKLFFVTYTVCQALYIKDIERAMGYLESDEFKIVRLPHEGKEIDFHCVTVEGAYSLVFSSSLEMINTFLVWFNERIIGLRHEQR